MILPNDFTESVVTVAPYELRAHGPNASQYSSEFERERTAKCLLRWLSVQLKLRVQLVARSVALFGPFFSPNAPA